MFWGLNFHCFPVLNGHQPNTFHQDFLFKVGWLVCPQSQVLGCLTPYPFQADGLRMKQAWKQGNMYNIYIHMQNAYHT